MYFLYVKMIYNTVVVDCL